MSKSEQADDAAPDPDQADRAARMNRNGDGEPLGVMVFVSADELARMGIDVEERESLRYVVSEAGVTFD